MTEQKMILLEGNIGAGKSTLGCAWRASGLFEFIPEPVPVWKQDFAADMLDTFYRDMGRWAFTFQITTLATRVKTRDQVAALTEHPRVLLERSIFTDRYVFALTLRYIGAISEAEWQVYERLWNFVVSHTAARPHAILYLRTPAEVCLERIRCRGRAEESGVSLAYLQQLESLHDAWLLSRERVVVLDGTQTWTAQQVLDRMAHLLE